VLEGFWLEPAISFEFCDERRMLVRPLPTLETPLIRQLVVAGAVANVLTCSAASTLPHE
jgi:hypothetical protein